jgi:hypothetical protein
MTRVYLENGKTWTFACAVDWPGWCRRGKGEEAAVEALLDYAPRYRTVAGRGFVPGDVEVVGRVRGNATTDFGAPGAGHGRWDKEPLTGSELRTHVDLLRASWRYFDAVVARAPAELRKGPRGGGRDRDAVVAHVQEAERAYGRRAGVRVPPRTPWADQREALTAALLDGPDETPKWPPRYSIRRIAWHVLDHAWEIEDRSTATGDRAPRTSPPRPPRR